MSHSAFIEWKTNRKSWNQAAGSSFTSSGTVSTPILTESGAHVYENYNQQSLKGWATWYPLILGRLVELLSVQETHYWCLCGWGCLVPDRNSAVCVQTLHILSKGWKTYCINQILPTHIICHPCGEPVANSVFYDIMLCHLMIQVDSWEINHSTGEIWEVSSFFFTWRACYQSSPWSIKN